MMFIMMQVSDKNVREGPDLPIQPRIASKQDHPQRGEIIFVDWSGVIIPYSDQELWAISYSDQEL